MTKYVLIARRTTIEPSQVGISEVELENNLLMYWQPNIVSDADKIILGNFVVSAYDQMNHEPFVVEISDKEPNEPFFCI
jgi:hypothetical protein